MGDIFKAVGGALSGAVGGSDQSAPAQAPMAQAPVAQPQQPLSTGDFIAQLLSTVGQQNQQTPNYLGVLGLM